MCYSSIWIPWNTTCLYVGCLLKCNSNHFLIECDNDLVLKWFGAWGHDLQMRSKLECCFDITMSWGRGPNLLYLSFLFLYHHKAKAEGLVVENGARNCGCGTKLKVFACKVDLPPTNRSCSHLLCPLPSSLSLLSLLLHFVIKKFIFSEIQPRWPTTLWPGGPTPMWKKQVEASGFARRVRLRLSKAVGCLTQITQKSRGVLI